MTKGVIITDPDAKTKVEATTNLYTRNDGSKDRLHSIYTKTENNIVVDNQFRDVIYYPDGNLWQANMESQRKASTEGTYEVTDIVIKANEQWSVNKKEHRTDDSGNQQEYQIDLQCQDTNRIVYTEHVVKAGGVQDAMNNVSQYFPNDPEENKDEVSYRSVNAVDLHTEKGTEINLDNNDVTNVNQNSRIEEYSNYTYIGDTGKFVGWDWTWIYNYVDDNAVANGESVLTYYTVTEYKYSADTDSWTKTQIEAYAKDTTNGSDIGFKENDPTATMNQILADYNVNRNTYVFDSSDSGMDNWKKTSETSEIPEADTDIILGTSEITVDDDLTLEQNVTKEDMLELTEKLKDEAMNGADFFEEVVTDDVLVPDGEELLDAVEDIFENGTLPESNTEDTVTHIHNNDGSTVTIIDGDASNPSGADA